MDPNGTVQTGYCAQLAPNEGGFDRHELYADPWGSGPGGQRIYVSTQCKRMDEQIDVVFASADSGTTWSPSTIRLPGGWEPLAMTSTASGRLFMTSCFGTTPLLYWSDDGGETIASRDPTGSIAGVDVSYVAGGVAEGCTALPAVPSPMSPYPVGVGAGQPQMAVISIARVNDTAVLIAYPNVESYLDSNGQQSLRQVQRIVWVVTPDPGTSQPATVIPVMTLRAQAEAGSVLQPFFIQDNRPDAPTPRTAAIFWEETSSLPSMAGVQMHAMYRIVTGALGWQPPSLLSSSAGWTVPAASAGNFRGDYMQGGFYFANGLLNFVMAWPETPRIMARIISLGPPAASALPNPSSLPGARLVTPSVARPCNAPSQPPSPIGEAPFIVCSSG